MATDSASIGPSPRRFEVITGEPERRTHEDAFKARLVAQSFAADVCIADLAREHGLHPQLLYTWRAQARRRQLALPAEREPFFAAVLQAPAGEGAPPASATALDDDLVLEMGDLRLHIGADVAPQRVAAMVSALKAVR